MLLKQFFTEKLAHNSYLIGGSERCAVIDPDRDVEKYMSAAEEEGLKITHVIETHLHADFVSGHLDLAGKTGALIYAPAEGKCLFDHLPLKNGDEFLIENIKFHVLEAPGHTPESLVYVVSDLSRGPDPVLAFTGDTLLVNDVGRPDISTEKSRELAGMLYKSLHETVMKLPDSCIVFPAHGEGSLCGRAIGSMRFSTIGYEKKHNSALLLDNPGSFIDSLTNDMPPAPDHFPRCSEINRKGPVPVSELKNPVSLTPEQFKSRIKGGNTVVISTEDYPRYGGNHIPGSYNIYMNGNFSTFAGWVIPPDKDILLVTQTNEEVKTAVVMLRRVGLDRAAGYLKGGMHSWVSAGYDTSHICQLSPPEVFNKLNNEEWMLLDVRSKNEYEGGHIDGAVNIPVADLRTEYKRFDPEKRIIAMCRTGRRSSLACSILKQNGFENIYNAEGGVTGYKNGGFMD
ncbi:glyoxylase-like metal-dependent hydrolase (beta-lactamase superfamily II)/rhodanese-related sulfurtransferase [Methanomicrobium sp. W14]|uniref:MBL fold metallo-hydrolase n=1 Tax=Methanomicrobium sp. W14 TaxID=2817839 RepID=UPI001AE34DFC|nr:MBL fold metallo-hydrolase [Methanomicrobium sp. W14]MBP2132666.1 glyoxylase-like metal-dependent hydrolase (beta-lactamase superfamily II)/rhodanese-related sulfurtransferase [Methanomicrobium sp. W14]